MVDEGVCAAMRLEVASSEWCGRQAVTWRSKCVWPGRPDVVHGPTGGPPEGCRMMVRVPLCAEHASAWDGMQGEEDEEFRKVMERSRQTIEDIRGQQPVRVTPMLTSGFVPIGTPQGDLAALVAGAVAQVPGICAAVGIVPGPSVDEVRAAYPGALGWEKYGPAAGTESMIAALLVGSRGRGGDLDGLLTEVHRAVAAAWTERWGDSSSSLPLDTLTWTKTRAMATNWTVSTCDDLEMVEAVRLGSRG